jgi:hypothetical protein
MPKVHNTRKQKARELHKLATAGPSFSESPIRGEEFTAEEATVQYRRWSQSWLLPLVEELVPELRKKKEA